MFNVRCSLRIPRLPVLREREGVRVPNRSRDFRNENSTPGVADSSNQSQILDIHSSPRKLSCMIASLFAGYSSEWESSEKATKRIRCGAARRRETDSIEQAAIAGIEAETDGGVGSTCRVFKLSMVRPRAV